MPSHPLLNALLSFHLAAAAALLLPGPAQACSCVSNGTDFLAPADGSTDVPTNTRIWVGGFQFGGDSLTTEELNLSPPFILARDDGAQVELIASIIKGNNELIAVFTPAAELVAGGVYSLGEEIYSLDNPVPTLVVLATFTVGAEADLEAPELPSELARSSSASPRVAGQVSSCGPTDVVDLSIEATGQVLLAQVGEGRDFDTEALDGEVSELSLDGELDLGVGGCRWSWPEAKPGATADAQWGALDLAGNFSGWTEPTEIVIPAAGCSCSTQGAGVPAGSGAILALLLLIGGGRRRRPQPGCRP